MLKHGHPSIKLNTIRNAERNARIRKKYGKPAWQVGLSDSAIEYLKTQGVNPEVPEDESLEELTQLRRLAELYYPYKRHLDENQTDTDK